MTSKRTVLLGTAGLGLLLMSACTQPSEVLALRCDVDVDSMTPASAEVGDTVTLTGSPYTSVHDSAVYVGNARATVTSAERDGCTTCDACRLQAGCTECGDCDVCDYECSTNCTESVTFVVPDVPGGSHGVQLFNSHGQSRVEVLEVVDYSPVDDSGQDDTGSSDTGSDGLAPRP